MRKILTITLLSSSLLFAACGGPSEEELARQDVFETNVANAPAWTDEQKNMIIESRGVVIGEEENEEEEMVEIRNSYSPGENVVDTLAAMTREELLALDSTAHMEIFINGVIRDEYTVAAHTLYGADRIAQFKKKFSESLTITHPEAGIENSEIPEGATYVDMIGLKTDINDSDVARHHVDVITSQLNRIFVKILPHSNFGDRVLVKGQVYPIELKQQLLEVNEAAFEFTGITPEKYRNRMTDTELKKLNEYYNSTFANALIEAPISESKIVESEIGGFEQKEDGTWEPAQMEIFAWNLIKLIYGIDI